MANSTYRHYRVAQRIQDTDQAVEAPLSACKIKQAMHSPYLCLLIIPCILTLILGFCLGKCK